MISFLIGGEKTIDYILIAAIAILFLAITILLFAFIFINRVLLKKQYFLRSRALDEMEVLISFDIDNKMISFDKFFTTKIKINQDAFDNKMTLISFKEKIIETQQSKILVDLYKKTVAGSFLQEDWDEFLQKYFNHRILYFSINDESTAKININNFALDNNNKILRCNTTITTFPNEFAIDVANRNEKLLSPRRIILNIKKDIRKKKTKKLVLIAINLDESFLNGILYSNIIDFFISFSDFIKKSGYITYNQNNFTIYIADHGTKFVGNSKQLLNKWALIIEELKNKWEDEIGINSIDFKFSLAGTEGVISDNNDLLEMLSKIKYELYLKNHNNKTPSDLDYSLMIENLSVFQKEITESKSSSLILRDQSIIRNKDFFILNPNLSYEQQFYLNNVYYSSDIIWGKLINKAILIAKKDNNKRLILKIPRDIIFQTTLLNIIVPQNLFLVLELNNKLNNSNFIKDNLQNYSFSLIVDKPIVFNEELITTFGTKNIFIANGFLQKYKQEFLYDKTYNELTKWANKSKDNHLFLFK